VRGLALAEKNNTPRRNISFIGVGNEYRQDDGLGILIARDLGLRHLAGARVAEIPRDTTHLMNLWPGADIVFVFDAVYSGGTAGTVYRFDPIKEPLPGNLFQFSTHALGIAQAVELSRVLNQLPAELILYGIEGKNFGQGQGLSLTCKRSALKVVQRVLDEIRN
jgi:hydrogenase maturation protease